MGLFDRFKTPKWKDNDWKVRCEAIKELDDEKILYEIAKNDSDALVRLEAVKKISDEVVLIDIAKNDDYDGVRLEAVEKISDEAVLIDIAKNDPYYFVRCGAIDKITDKTVLEDIAKKDSDKTVRNKATGRINDLTVLSIDEYVDQLITLYRKNPEGFESTRVRPVSKNGLTFNDIKQHDKDIDKATVRKIGSKLNDIGGFDYMLEAHEMFSAKVNIPGAARNLEMVWDGIGNWRG